MRTQIQSPWDISTTISPMTEISEKRVQVIIGTSRKSRKIGLTPHHENDPESAKPTATWDMDFPASTSPKNKGEKSKIILFNEKMTNPIGH